MGGARKRKIRGETGECLKRVCSQSRGRERGNAGFRVGLEFRV
jgi:hypothetical protein